MKYLTIQEIRYLGSPFDLSRRIEDLADALYDIEENDPAIEDPDLAARITDGYVEVQMVVEADDPAEAMTKALCALRSAVHDAVPGWETERPSYMSHRPMTRTGALPAPGRERPGQGAMV